ncbi:MAG: hypothetical protein OHK0022_37890 [Roseiflexaceae bacterium]
MRPFSLVFSFWITLRGMVQPLGPGADVAVDLARAVLRNHRVCGQHPGVAALVQLGSGMHRFVRSDSWVYAGGLGVDVFL